jgi:hypothetical protein
MTVLIVALVLADHADYDGKVWMSIASVAVQARVARSTVYSAISALEALGELERVRQGGKAGPGDATTYRLTLVDKLPKRVRQPDPSTRPKGVQKGSDCVDLKRNYVSTYKGAREETRETPVDFPPPVADITVRVAEARRGLDHGMST